MGEFVVQGGRRLAGTLRVNGAKNAVLPLMAASLLADRPVFLEGVPDLTDVEVMVAVLRALGAVVERDGDALTIDPRPVQGYAVPAELMQRMRASMFVLGPLLARMGRAEMVQPGGCAIGERPVDLHLHGLAALGARVEEDGPVTRLVAERPLRGADIHLAYPSVGATENLMMAAAGARGETHIQNAAQEPEIVDLAVLLSEMGVTVRGAGTPLIRVVGRAGPLSGGVRHAVIPDRIEAGTFLLAAAATGGEVVLDNALAVHLPGLLEVLREAGAEVWSPRPDAVALA
ncbi:MAG: UDP-N-acetylglucosamine 1-carboxyvinyltransferase, partial [Firmicutes bacterium]|nr:UDP-N-acetylglucosamine 1-carboxyvinyltransferase [Bacillota bacterium]